MRDRMANLRIVVSPLDGEVYIAKTSASNPTIWLRHVGRSSQFWRALVAVIGVGGKRNIQDKNGNRIEVSIRKLTPAPNSPAANKIMYFGEESAKEGN